jgi:hypothetical protein
VGFIQTRRFILKIVITYDFNGGKDKVLKNYEEEFQQISQVIKSIDANEYKTKISEEQTMKGKLLYSPTDLNKAFKNEFAKEANGGWNHHSIKCDYSNLGESTNDYKTSTCHGAFRDMDFVKPGKKLGIEVQFGKYAFMVYNVCAKMTIFKNKGIIDAGVEIVPVKKLADEMSSGVSYFEQFAWDLNYRGVSNIDTPVYILGIDV